MTRIKIIFKALQILSLAVLFSCGGTWENDETVWKKTFNSEKPKEVTIVNSKIWVSSHWSYEFQSFMEVKSNKKLLDAFEKQYELEDSQEFEVIEITEKPKWFTPKTEEHYIIKKSNLYNDFRIFIDKQTKNLFITCSQL
ncbi:MAG: hypothetical protein JNM71_08340 [Flavobacterium lindanitolerans]|uniref:hypothetical protein n=1 Tax=Flavobacterium TaxID=237 RepID=UPI0006FBE2C9|nr:MULTISPECIES: hypothetical protein [Flavobacterium]MBU7571329.1 hypothetical protein [Flavobacterium sp.]PZO32481.1 MAG: hypothetical protein DCE86_07395 [Flavobacteriaceae bacterium]PZQ86412.1 MAG: hypothetical protein DI548_07215 [Flavobacterium johnsoniae]KQS53282.1 hypothetical protein ASG38_00665 [Flavobacterium sp. Leaf359]MBL7868016.1 hypothetical protein [Flavobacterium lindanitolerans]